MLLHILFNLGSQEFNYVKFYVYCLIFCIMFDNFEDVNLMISKFEWFGYFILRNNLYIDMNPIKIYLYKRKELYEGYGVASIIFIEKFLN